MSEQTATSVTNQSSEQAQTSQALSNTTQNFAEIYQSSIENKEQFWAEQAKRIYWHKEPEQILDDSNLPFAQWYVGGETNLCYNCVDRHLRNAQSRMLLSGCHQRLTKS